MSAKGIARLGLACLLAGLCNMSHARSVDNLLISEEMANPAVILDAQRNGFESKNQTDAIFKLRDSVFSDDGSNLLRIETDLLILPQDYLSLARLTADQEGVPRLTQIPERWRHG